VVTSQEVRTPALGREFRALLPGCPGNYLRRQGGDGRVPGSRWVPPLDYQDSDGRAWKVNALEGTETPAGGKGPYFAWLTPLPVNRQTVAEVAQQGWRYRWKVEDEGFNRQKQSGVNLGHVSSSAPEKGKAYDLLLPMAFIRVQLVERGSRLRRLAAEAGRPFGQRFGSLKNASTEPPVNRHAPGAARGVAAVA
jgi:hypothetical protein